MVSTLHSGFIAMTSESANPSTQSLLAEITTLRQEIANLQREKADLELLMEMTTEYSDDVTEDLYTTVENTRHLLQNIADSMPSALITLDGEGRVITWNPAAKELTGKSIHQVRDQLLWQVCPELARYQELFEQVINQKKIMYRHKEQLVSTNKELFYDVSIFPLTNKIKGVVLRIDNVTQRIQLEDMMLQAAKMASVGGLAAGIAHEINNPLSGMLQGAQVLQNSLDTQRSRTRERLQDFHINPDSLEQYLQKYNLTEYLLGIRTAGERAAKIVSDLLSFARKSTSKALPHNFNELVEKTLVLASADYDIKKKFDFKNLDVTTELAPDLPDVVCDKQQIEQVIFNLIRNATHALALDKQQNPHKQGRLILRTRRPSPSIVRLEVEDNGPGIPEKERTHLFEPFFTTKPPGEGTGLGLWLSWSIVVERHKGKIWAEAGQQDQGIRFVVELPVERS
jgi:PAS domain S-box-containing protein